LNQSSLYEYLKNGKQRAKIVIVAGEKEAQRAKAVYEYMDLKSFELPDIRLLPGDDTRSYMEDIAKAFNQLRAFEKFKSSTLIAPFRTLTMLLPKPEYLKSFTIEFGTSLDLEELKSKLFYWGYEFVDVVSAKGEVSIRGDIVDIFPPNAKKAVRVALFDSEVEEIRHFDISTQKREKEELESVEIIRVNTQRETDMHELQKIIESVGLPYKSFDNRIEAEKEYLVFGSFYTVEAFLKAQGVKSIESE
jgi:transcription-repair coupling factor (superfamily II helicase)